MILNECLTRNPCRTNEYNVYSLALLNFIFTLSPNEVSKRYLFGCWLAIWIQPYLILYTTYTYYNVSNIYLDTYKHVLMHCGNILPHNHTPYTTFFKCPEKKNNTKHMTFKQSQTNWTITLVIFFCFSIKNGCMSCLYIYCQQIQNISNNKFLSIIWIQVYNTNITKHVNSTQCEWYIT